MTDPELADCPPFCAAAAGGDCDHDPGFVIPGWRVDWPLPVRVDAEWARLAEAVTYISAHGSIDEAEWDLIEKQYRPRIEAAIRSLAEPFVVKKITTPLTYLRCSVCGTPVDDDRCPHCGDIA